MRQLGINLPLFGIEIFEDPTEQKLAEGALKGAWYVTADDGGEVITTPARKLSFIIGTLFSVTFAQAEEPIGFFSPTSAHPVSVVILKKLNDWPVLTVYSHSSSASGSYSTYVFDGKKYIRSSIVELYDKSVDELFQKFKAVKEIASS